MARAPTPDQWLPARSMRRWTRCLADASTAPEAMGNWCLRNIGYCIRVAFELKQPLGNAPALVDLADEVFLRDLDVGQEHFGKMPCTVDQLNGPHIDALGLHVDQDEADALLLAALIGSN